MTRDYLLLDTSFLCWREFYGAARRDEHAVIPGIVEDVPKIAERFRATPVWFCDRGPYKRAEIYPKYKLPDKKPDPLADKEKAACRRTIDKFRDEVLPAKGHRVYQEPGYEADDLIASFVRHMPADCRAILVSRDEDLYQLLSPSVCTHNPISGGGMTESAFREKYGLGPGDWAEVKALAGCSSDNIDGAYRIGEATAVKYLRGDLHKIESFRRKIIEAYYASGSVKENLRLTRLPFPGTPRVGPE